MPRECKLCGLLGTISISDTDENATIHAELHARQLDLISRSDTVDSTAAPNGSDPGKRIGRVPKEKSNKSALFRFFRELVNVHGRNCSFKCSQCEISIRSRPSIAHTTDSFVNHACSHLNEDLFACRHCDFKFVSRSGIISHLRNIHALSGIRANYIDMTENHQGDIMDMVKLCLGKTQQKQLNVTNFGAKRRRNLRSQAPLMKVAYRLLSNRCGDRIKCHLCTRSILNNRWSADKFLDHARWHLDKPIFTCRLCQYSASTERTIKGHLGNKHSVAQSQQNFKDGSNEFYENISSLLEDCFGNVKREGPPVISKEQERAHQTQAQIRTRCGTNKLLAERKLRCAALVQKFRRSGKLRCRLCQDQLGASTIQAPMDHAFSHFYKLLFTCRRCPYNSTTKPTMRCHVWSKHGPCTMFTVMSVITA